MNDFLYKYKSKIIRKIKILLKYKCPFNVFILSQVHIHIRSKVNTIIECTDTL